MITSRHIRDMRCVPEYLVCLTKVYALNSATWTNIHRITTMYDAVPIKIIKEQIALNIYHKIE